ncbi:MAG: hypothetical protein ACTSO7_07450 [Candidatus Heimdallarchaeota archaeon]
MSNELPKQDDEMETTEEENILESLLITSIAVQENVLKLQQETTFHVILDYKVTQDLILKPQYHSSDLCLVKLPEKLELTTDQTSLEFTGEIIAQKSGNEEIKLIIGYNEQTVHVKISLIILPDVSISFKEYPKEMIAINNPLYFKLNCFQKTNGGKIVPITVFLKEKDSVVLQDQIIQINEIEDHRFSIRCDTTGFKDISVEFTILGHLITTITLFDKILVYDPQKLPENIGKADMFIGENPKFDLFLPFMPETKGDLRLEFREIVDYLSNVCYLAFPFNTSSETTWDNLEVFIVNHGSSEQLLIANILPIKQSLIILAAETSYQELQLQKVAENINKYLERKPGECQVQVGPIAYGSILTHFRESKIMDKIQPIIISEGFLERPVLLAATLNQLVDSL